jgi:hypothetical protein
MTEKALKYLYDILYAIDSINDFWGQYLPLKNMMQIIKHKAL